MNRKWLTVGVILLIVCVVGVLIVLGNIGQVTQQGAGPVVDAPYQIAKRPMPSSSDPAILLPPNVGSFKRDAHITNIPGTPQSAGTSTPTGLSTVYSSGTDIVDAAISIFSSAAQAQSYIVGLPKINASYVFYGMNPQVTFAANGPQGGMSRLAYSRGPYLFFFVASTPGSMDTFMAQYPY